jgi:hypothetical protein
VEGRLSLNTWIGEDGAIAHRALGHGGRGHTAHPDRAKASKRASQPRLERVEAVHHTPTYAPACSGGQRHGV